METITRVSSEAFSSLSVLHRARERKKLFLFSLYTVNAREYQQVPAH